MVPTDVADADQVEPPQRASALLDRRRRALASTNAPGATTFANELEGYERLLHDTMLGDHTLFTSADGIERLWEVSTPLLEQPPYASTYARGSWGRGAIDELVAPHRWPLPYN